jgi:hypothetical protein
MTRDDQAYEALTLWDDPPSCFWIDIGSTRQPSLSIGGTIVNTKWSLSCGGNTPIDSQELLNLLIQGLQLHGTINMINIYQH